ncbi:uncharacterized protein LOC121424397 [Lytechinus variegatus]|uniref:uncharacterized protein LOC121424397 n=1 Tax=Lytechinus variegatus TaxID=7654 RepID=UPI001BB2507B|nr:uncharacterized protein LOC121424397 [Lytechinus variegatus]
MSVTSANPATPYTRAEFFNACTSVLEGLNCLQRQQSVIDERSWEVLNRLGKMVSDLRPEVKQNKEYWVDGPLVRFLTANVLKAKSVLQEMKRTCSQKSAAINGQEYIERHLVQHVEDIRTALEELETYHQQTLFRTDTVGIDSGVGLRMNTVSKGPTEMTSGGLTKTPPAEISLEPKGSETFMKNVNDAKIATSDSYPGTNSHPVTTMWSSGTHHPEASKPGVFEHIQEMTNIYPEHDPNWPKRDQKPNLPFERTQPPLVYPGIRNMHNYGNLPQFTGKNLPMPKIPDGEMGLRAPHVAHWDSTNHYTY